MDSINNKYSSSPYAIQEGDWLEGKEPLVLVYSLYNE